MTNNTINNILNNKEWVRYQDSPDTTDVAYTQEATRDAMVEFAIKILKEHIESSTKPGYKRKDILNKIEQLKLL